MKEKVSWNNSKLLQNGTRRTDCSTRPKPIPRFAPTIRVEEAIGGERRDLEAGAFRGEEK